MQKLSIFILLLINSFLFAQKNVHIEYLNVRSEIATVKEDLYTDGKNVLSKQDENINLSTGNNYNVKKGNAFYFISKLKENDNGKDFFFNSFLKGEKYLVYDIVPKIEWNIEKSITRKILGYNCFKATGIFRGAEITAYFTYEIPYGIGPFKFYGLPGAILDVREDGKAYDIWKAVKIDLDHKLEVNYTPAFENSTKISNKDFVKLQDETNVNNGNKITVPGSTSRSISTRLSVEKIYEWEK